MPVWNPDFRPFTEVEVIAAIVNALGPNPPATPKRRVMIEVGNAVGRSYGPNTDFNQHLRDKVAELLPAMEKPQRLTHIAVLVMMFDMRKRTRRTQRTRVDRTLRRHPSHHITA